MKRILNSLLIFTAVWTIFVLALPLGATTCISTNAGSLNLTGGPTPDFKLTGGPTPDFKLMGGPTPDFK